MLAFRRIAGQSAGKLRVGRARYSSTHHGKEAGSHADHGHHHSGPVNESLGVWNTWKKSRTITDKLQTQLYVVLAIIPASFALYTASRNSQDGSIPGISKVIEKYSDLKDKWSARNTLHTSMIEQAAFDRNLYQSAVGSSHINLRFPEWAFHFFPTSLL
jgi:hypothetical protein